MCGIAGYMSLGKERPSPDKLVKLFDRLEIRGTDASGIAHPKNGKLQVYKDGIRSVELMRRKKFMDVMKNLPSTMIFHCRASTHGSEKENKNNHPIHTGGNIALVHNGVIRNHDEIGKKPKGVEVDTMAIMHLIDTYSNVGMFSEALGKLSGSMACAVLRVDDDGNKLWLFRESNPIVYIQDTDTDILYFASSDHILDAMDASGTMFDMPTKIMVEFSQNGGLITDTSKFEMKSGYSINTTSTRNSRTTTTHSLVEQAKWASIDWSPPEDDATPIGDMKYNMKGLWEKITKDTWHYTPFSGVMGTSLIFVNGKPYESGKVPKDDPVSDVEFTVLGNEKPDSATDMSNRMLEAYNESAMLRSAALQALEANHNRIPGKEGYSPAPHIRVPTYGLETLCPNCKDTHCVYRSFNESNGDCFRCAVCDTKIPEEDIFEATTTVSTKAF